MNRTEIIQEIERRKIEAELRDFMHQFEGKTYAECNSFFETYILEKDNILFRYVRTFRPLTPIPKSAELTEKDSKEIFLEILNGYLHGVFPEWLNRDGICKNRFKGFT